MKPVAPVTNALIEREWGMGNGGSGSSYPDSPLPTPHSNSHQLNVDFPVVGAVELGKENVLPGPEFQPAVNDWDGNAVADHDRAKMGIGVPAITVGEQRIIV